MNPMLKQLMATLTAPATENLVQDAVDANNTAGSTDPEQVQKNVDFQAELERLKNLQGDTTDTPSDPVNTDSGDGGSDGGSGGSEDGGGSEPTDPAPDTGADPDNGDTSSDPENKDGQEDPEEDPGNGEAEASSDDTEEADAPSEDAEVATEALRTAAEALGAVYRAHEYGVVKPHHLSLFDTALESQFINLGATARPAVSRESDAPESSADRLRYAAGKVKEFLKQVLAKMREYYGKVMAWLKAAYQGYQESHGRFQKNLEGLTKRIAYLKGKERPEEEIAALAEKKPISLRALSTDGEVPTAETIKDAIATLIAIGKGIKYSVTDDSAYGVLLDLVGRANENDMERVVVGDVNALTAERMFRIAGSSSVFGNSHIYKNVTRADTAMGGMEDFNVSGLLGLNTYHWELAKDDAANLDELVHQNHGYGFKVSTERRDVQGPLLTSLDDCSAVLQLTAPLIDELLSFKNVQTIMTSTQGVFVKSQDMMKQLVELVDLEEDIKIKVLMVHSTSQAAYTNLFVKSVTNHLRVVDNAIAAIQQWVAASLNIIAAEKAPEA